MKHYQRQSVNGHQEKGQIMAREVLEDTVIKKLSENGCAKQKCLKIKKWRSGSQVGRNFKINKHTRTLLTPCAYP